MSGLQIQIAHDTVSPDLVRKLRAMEKPQQHLEAMGLALVALTKRAFTDSSLRPSPWAARKDGSPASLRKTGMLWQSIRITALDTNSVTVGSDRAYAAAHQLGSSKRGIPARPFFPFSESGIPTDRAKKAVEMALRASFRSAMGS